MKTPNDARPGTLSLDTLAVHAGREDFGLIGVHAPPLDLSTTYPTGDLADATASIDAMGRGLAPTGSFIYARLHNPTVARFEKALASLEGAEDAVAFCSGMAALTAVVARRARARRHARGGGPSRLRGQDRRCWPGACWGRRSRARIRDQAIKASVRPDTALVSSRRRATRPWTSSISRGGGREAGPVPVLVDSTFATPVLQSPLEHGRRARAAQRDQVPRRPRRRDGAAWWRRARPGRRGSRQVRVATGALLHPAGAPTCCTAACRRSPLRVEGAQGGRDRIAERAASHPAVTRAHHRTRGSRAETREASSAAQMRDRAALLAFEVVGGCEAALRVLRAVKLHDPGGEPRLGRHAHPAPGGPHHRVLTRQERESSGISERCCASRWASSIPRTSGRTSSGPSRPLTPMPPRPPWSRRPPPPGNRKPRVALSSGHEGPPRGPCFQGSAWLMAYRIRRVEYFHATVVDEPGEAYKVLSALAGSKSICSNRSRSMPKPRGYSRKSSGWGLPATSPPVSSS